MDAQKRYPSAFSTPGHAGKPLVRFGPSTFRRIEQVLRPGESRAAFVREAVRCESERREQEADRQRRLARVSLWIA